MTYEELVERLKAAVPDARYAVDWYEAGTYSEANYTIVPLPEGRFTLYRPTGRGENRQDVDLDGEPLIFESEDAVCQYVWKKATAPKPPVETVALPSAEALAEQRRQIFATSGIPDPRLASD